MWRKLSYLLFAVVTIFVFGSCSLKARIKRADKQYDVGEYYAASLKYKKVLSKIPAKEKALRARVAFNQAECQRIINYNTAEQMYANAIRYGYKDSIVYFRYAQVLQRNGKYPDAAKNYSIYLKNSPNNEAAKNGLMAQKLVDKYKANPTGYIVKKYDAFNSNRTYTFSPSFLTADADVLFFTSNRVFSKKNGQKNSAVTGLADNNIYSVRKNASGKWEKPAIIGSEVNTITTDDGACSFTADGSVMFFTRARQQADAEIGTEIYISNRAGGAWSEAKKIEIFKDSAISVAHPAIAPDGETLYFVSDSPDGLGGKDIWRAKYDKGECKEIENLGSDINTPGDEMFPTVRSNGVLYFSSNGLAGLGGLDLYKATPKKEGGWDVQHMGVPLNSNADDFGMAFESSGEKGFFTSNRGQNRGYDGLWTFELPAYEYILEGKVYDESLTPIPDAVIRLVSNTGMIVRVQSKKDGTYRIKVDKNMDCVMMASARGYLNKEGKLSTQGVKESKVFKQDFQLSTIYKPIQIENIFYEFGKWNLTPASETGLQELVKVLKDNPNITIEISAHTDFVGNNESNKLLSEKRAKSVVDYLITAGIDAARLTSVGYGEEKPMVVDALLAQKYTFLKENDVLDEAFVSKLAVADQEKANQINRRTEFRVVKTTYK